MSSPKVGTKPASKAVTKTIKVARRLVANAKPKVTATVKAKAADTPLSTDAIKLAREIDAAFKKSDHVLSEDAMQTLMGTLCRIYSAQVESGVKYTPIAEGQVVSPTAVMVTASGLLRAANLAVFELGMWQSWTGR